MLFILDQIDKTLAKHVADGLGVEVPKKLEGPLNMNFPADASPKEYQPLPMKKPAKLSPALSMANTPKNSIKTRKVAFLVGDGVDDTAINGMKAALLAEGAMAMMRGPPPSNDPSSYEYAIRYAHKPGCNFSGNVRSDGFVNTGCARSRAECSRVGRDGVRS